MAVSMSPKQKVYQGILQEIRELIDRHNLKPGDKIPSERELSGKLQAGRSSIREALRAMELLGLIETRHGEGTFLSNYQPYQTVEILASFILQENSTKRDLVLAKQIIEKEITKLAYQQLTPTNFKELQSILEENKHNPKERHVAYFRYILNHTDNLLLAKIWYLMEDFSSTVNNLYYDDYFYQALQTLLYENRYGQIERLFMNTSYKETE
ncbi:FadR/GntR family transcriptional regulator [Oceanobacillus halotolerans]|uniref:FadR/GntR family transcriptional regulator n=1 Tax=Oceanobacillus halotolerans TaxID=2663380 RepID=UPI0013DA3C36|nr:GntR family transcriptional regulator [Oceanobacillus halotolerans]